MLLPRDTYGFSGGNNRGVDFCKGLVQGIEPPVRLLLCGSLFILVQGQCGAFSGDYVFAQHIVKQNFQ